VVPKVLHKAFDGIFNARFLNKNTLSKIKNVKKRKKTFLHLCHPCSQHHLQPLIVAAAAAASTSCSSIACYNHRRPCNSLTQIFFTTTDCSFAIIWR